jgi:PAS domain S-box-containing protein
MSQVGSEEGSDKESLRLRAMLASISDGVIAVDLDGCIIFMNAVAEKLTGWQQVDALEQQIEQVFHIKNEKTRAIAPNPLEKVLREGIVQGLANHTILVARDGTERPIDDSGAPIQDENGRAIGAILVFRDITERKLTELQNANLLEREQQARREAEAARDAARAAEVRLTFLAEASRILATSLGYETTLQTVAKLAVPQIADWCAVDLLSDDGSLARLAVEHVDPAKVEWARELQRRNPPDPDSPSGAYGVLRSGKPIFYPQITDEMLVAAAPDSAALELARAIGFSSVITVPLVARGQTFGVLTLVAAESKKNYGAGDVALAEELARRAAVAIDNAKLYQQAQEAIKARDQFLSVASHELRSPLTALRTNAQLIQRRVSATGQVSEKDHQALKMLVSQTRRLNDMVSAMLDLSRIETGQLSLNKAAVDICALTQQVVGEMRMMLEGRQLDLTMPGRALIVDGDALRLQQVLLNLLHNADRYDPSGGEIKVVVQEIEGRACLSVIDRGIGIPGAAQARLFQHFYRAPNASTVHATGMGIGLYVVKEIVVLHGGEVSVDSQEGEGSTFTVCLPLER